MKYKNIFIYILAPMFLLMVFFAPAIPMLSAQSSTDSANIIVESVPNSSLSDAVFEKVTHSWPWYVTRASGLLAGLLLTILMLSGIGFITGTTYRFLEPITAWATHKALGIALAISIVVHVAVLYFDKFVHFDIPSLLVPFVSDHKVVTMFGYSLGSLYVALGIVAFYLFITIVITSLLWINKKPHAWKLVHVVSYVAVVFVFIHALFLGTDLSGGIPRLLWILSFVILSYAFLKRLWRIKTV